MIVCDWCKQRLSGDTSNNTIIIKGEYYHFHLHCVDDLIDYLNNRIEVPPIKIPPIECRGKTIHIDPDNSLYD